jgi:hypothetical protein
MIQPFEAPQLKIERAKRHLQELRDEVASFMSREPYFVVCEPVRAPPGFVHYVGMINESVPTSLSTIIGDVIHNLRTSLDLLACDLVRIAHGETVSLDGVYFPFCWSESELPKMIKKRGLDGTGEAVIRAIHACAPYPNGNDGLRAIHDLDVLDKHQTLIPVLQAISIRPAVASFGKVQYQLPAVSSKITHNRQLLQAIIAPMALPVGARVPCDFALLFDEGTVFTGRDIIQQLDACVVGVEKTLDLFKSVVGNSPSGGGVGGS